jgi:hypothetical protein
MSPARFALSPSEVVSWDPILRHYLTADPLIFGAVHELRALVVESACICMRSPNRRRDRTIFPTLGAGSVVRARLVPAAGTRVIDADRSICAVNRRPRAAPYRRIPTDLVIRQHNGPGRPPRLKRRLQPERAVIVGHVQMVRVAPTRGYDHSHSSARESGPPSAKFEPAQIDGASRRATVERRL